MSVTVNDLLKLDILKDAKILVGEEGLGNKVSYVDVVEVPDIADYSKPETVYLTTTYPFINDVTTFERTVVSFIKNNVSALFIKLGRYIENIPREVYELANNHKFPIILLPVETVYSPIITEIARKICEDQEEKDSNNYSFQQKLNSLIVKSQGLNQLVDVLVEEVGGEIFVENNGGKLIYSTGQEDLRNFYGAKEWLNEDEHFYYEMCYYYFQNKTIFIMPAYLGAELQGNIVCIFEKLLEPEMCYYDPLKRSAVIVALELSREEAVYEKRIRQEQALLDGIIDNNEGILNDMSNQMQKIDWKIKGYQIFAVVNFERKNNYGMDHGKFEQSIQKAHFRLNQGLRREGYQVIIKQKTENLICFFNFNKDSSVPLKDGQDPLARLKERFAFYQQEFEKDFTDLVISVGLSKSAVNGENLRKKYEDAQKAVRIGKRAYGCGQIYDFEKMGIYRLLLTHDDTASMTEFYQDYLYPLVQYDQKHNSDFVQTVEMYYANDSNTLATAEQMYIHRNTLNYRLKRASEILGFDIDHVDNKQCLGIALKIKKLFNI